MLDYVIGHHVECLVALVRLDCVIVIFFLLVIAPILVREKALAMGGWLLLLLELFFRSDGSRTNFVLLCLVRSCY